MIKGTIFISRGDVDVMELEVICQDDEEIQRKVNQLAEVTQEDINFSFTITEEWVVGGTVA